MTTQRMESISDLCSGDPSAVSLPVTLDQDSAGRSAVREQHFTLEDGLTPSFGFVQSFILLTDHYILGRVLFISTVLLNMGVLLAFRFHQLPNDRGELLLMITSSVLLFAAVTGAADVSNYNFKRMNVLGL